MNTYVAFGIIGIIGNFVAALADVPLVKPGKPDKDEVIARGGVSSWWADVTSKRFILSSWLSFIGQPAAYIVMWLLADLIAKANGTLALALRINTFLGCYAGFSCHVIYCMKPLIYQKLHKKISDEESLEVMKSIDPVVMGPMIVGGLSLWLGSTIIVAIAIATGALAVPKLCILLNPVVSALILLTLKKCGVKIIGTLGVGYMLYSILLIIAGLA
ncbi:MAG: hypothetical protein J6A03_10985 [Lachnospiraceae bacterium]|nr:hypothetical protein [Lachnospiraceae bacterium]